MGRGSGSAKNKMRVGVMIGAFLLMLTSSDVPAAAQNDTSDREVRIVESEKKAQYVSGIPQVYYNSQWQTICDDMDQQTALVLCRMRGYQKGEAVKNALYGNGTAPFYKGVWKCGPGDTSLSDCEINSKTSPCGAAAGIICFNNTKDVLKMNLTDGVKKGKVITGRLRVELADLGWGSVCADDFNQFAADVACRFMGYKHGEEVAAIMGESEMYKEKFHMAGVICSADTDPSLLDCQHRIVSASTCPSQLQVTALRCNDATVRLQTTVPNVLEVGSVEQYVTGQGWTPVCDKDWDNEDAYVVCKELGFVDAFALCCGQLGVQDSTGVSSSLTSARCQGEEDFLSQCSPTTQNSACSSRASVICLDEPRDQTPTELHARLVRGDEITSGDVGRVQVQNKGFWGDVCLDRFSDFTNKEATVACRMLGRGYLGGEVVGYGSRGTRMWNSPQLSSRRPVWISSVKCNGNESSLQDCNVQNWGIGSSNCWESFVVCYHSELTLSIAASGQSYGRLQVVRDGLTGAVCAEHFEDVDAGVACRTLDDMYVGGTVLKEESVSTVQRPAYLSSVQCRGDEHNLFRCDSAWNSAPSCRDSVKQVAVSCFKDIELKFGQNRMSGMVVVHNMTTGAVVGKICSPNFKDSSAKVVCRQLGYKDGYALPAGVFGPAGRGYHTVAKEYEGLQCVGNEASIYECDTTSQSSACGPATDNYVSVSCFDQDTSPELTFGLDMLPDEGDQVAGRVSVKYKGASGFACDTHWTNAAANVLCGQLSRKMGMAFPYPGRYSGPFFVTGTNCQGNETSLATCSSMQPPCLDSSASGVVCYVTTAPKVIMSADGKIPGRGRVGVTVDGKEGRVSGDKWSDISARVACTSLGYEDGIALKFPKSDKPLFISQVDCLGSEKSLFECPSQGWRRHLSEAYTAPTAVEAGMMCFRKVKLVQATVTDKMITGIVAFMDSRGSWQTACDGMRTKEVSVTCRQLGFTDGSVLSSGNFTYTTSSSFTCAGTEASLWDCGQHAKPTCRKSARIICFNRSNDDTWEWSIEHGYHGEVQVKHQGMTGTVCKSGWTNATANVLCIEKGFQGGIAYGSSRKLSPELIWLSSVKCPSDATTMSQCTLDTAVSDYCRGAFYFTASVLCYRGVSAPQIMLVGGPDRSEGRVQIKYDGVSGTVCNKDWSGLDIQLLCMELGFHDGVAKAGSSYGNGSGPVYMSGLGCTLGENRVPEGSFFTCPNAGWMPNDPSCRDHSTDAGAKCFQLVKLGMTKSYGPVLYFKNGAYSLVCAADGFNDKAATVVCRGLGFSSGVALYDGAFGTRSEEIKVGKVHCEGNEEQFMDCTMENDYGTCASSYASVVCSDDGDNTAYKTTLEKGSYGVVVIRHMDHDGYICADNFTNRDTMRVVCSEENYSYGFAYHTPPQPDGAIGIYWMSNVTCNPYNRRLDECYQGSSVLPFGKHPTSSDCDRLGVFCARRYVGGRVSWRLVAANGSTDVPEGHVEVRINGTWGSVCSLNFGTSEVNVLCRQLGFNSGNVVDRTFGERNVALWVNSVQCSGDERNILDCQLVLGNHRDMCLKDVAVYCHAGVRFFERIWDQFVQYGYLQVQRTVGHWDYVCADTFSNHTADIVCRELGYVGGIYQSVAKRLWSSANITCAASVNKYQQCTISTDRSTLCPNARYAYLICVDVRNTPENLTVALSNKAGNPMVSRYGLSGYICGENFTDTEAKVICKQQGYANGYALKASRKTSDRYQPFLVSMLKCTGDEISVDKCSMGSLLTSMSDCGSQTLAQVLCTKTPEPIQFQVVPKNATNARPEVKIDGEWYLLSYYRFDSTIAAVFCRSIGYATGEEVYSRLPKPSGRKIAIDISHCYGNESSVLECEGNWGEVGGSGFTTSRYASISCYQSVRLYDRTGAADGMLMYYNSTSTRWGFICGQGFGETEAGVACRELGYDQGYPVCCSAYGIFYYGLTMANLVCNGSESSITQCQYTTDPNTIELCRYEDYAAVVCYNNTYSRGWVCGHRLGGKSVVCNAVLLTSAPPFGLKAPLPSNFGRVLEPVRNSYKLLKRS